METEDQKRIRALEEEMKALKSFTTIPFDIDKAFNERLGINGLARIIVSSKGATTENKAVNEAGASTYSVMDKPDAFLQVDVSGTTYYIPIFT